MKEKSLDKIVYPLIHFVKNLIIVSTMCVVIALVVAVVFSYTEKSPLYQTFVDTLGGLGLILMAVGGLLLVASTGLGAPRPAGGQIYGQELRHVQDVKEWKSELGPRVGQGTLLFVYGLILEIIVFAFL